MEELLAAAIILSGITLQTAWLFWLGVALLLIVLGSSIAALSRRRAPPSMRRSEKNPIITPDASHPWESEAVFNPAAVYFDGRVHLLYRAMGSDGVSRVGYASSVDGIHFDERLPQPVFMPFIPPAFSKYRNPLAKKEYRRDIYASGGGWGGSEDPRAVVIDDRLYMTFCMFESWSSMRMAITSIARNDFSAKFWKWSPHIFLSPPEQTNKNWVLFPEKIGGKYAVLHALTPRILIDYVDDLNTLIDEPIQSNNNRGGRAGHWDAFVRGASAPPLRTDHGWLLFYHGMNPEVDGIGYKVGAMLLDLNDPTKILYRSNEPVLVPTEWYENDWKAGVVYASGAIVKDGTLFLYYGGGDKTISVATAPLNRFLDELMHGDRMSLSPVK